MNTPDTVRAISPAFRTIDPGFKSDVTPRCTFRTFLKPPSQYDPALLTPPTNNQPQRDGSIGYGVSSARGLVTARRFSSDDAPTSATKGRHFPASRSMIHATEPTSRAQGCHAPCQEKTTAQDYTSTTLHHMTQAKSGAPTLPALLAPGSKAVTVHTAIQNLPAPPPPATSEPPLPAPRASPSSASCHHP